MQNIKSITNNHNMKVLNNTAEIEIAIAETRTTAFYNPGHNILALLKNLAQVRITTSKTALDI